MIVIMTNSRGIEMRWETGAHKAIDEIVEALKLNVPDWQKIRIEINNDKDQA